MKRSRIYIGPFAIDVIESPLIGDMRAVMFSQMRERLGDIERACAVAVSKHGSIEGFEIQTTPRYEDAETGKIKPGKTRLLYVIGEWEIPDIRVCMTIYTMADGTMLAVGAGDCVQAFFRWALDD